MSLENNHLEMFAYIIIQYIICGSLHVLRDSEIISGNIYRLELELEIVDVDSRFICRKT